MKLITSKGNEYDAKWADVASTTGNVMIKLNDTRRIPEIAEEFDGLDWIRREAENRPTTEFTGYTELQRIARASESEVLLTLAKGGNA